MNEQELIQGLREGNEPAFRWLVENYRNKVYHTILNIVQDEGDAQDATQEVFIKVFESIRVFRAESSLSTWIYQIATRKALDKLRRRNTRQKLLRANPSALFHHPGIALENKEKAAVLFKAIGSLPDKQRLAFTLIKVQGMSYDEVTGILQMKIKAVESLVSRAKQNLQRELESYYRKK